MLGERQESSLATSALGSMNERGGCRTLSKRRSSCAGMLEDTAHFKRARESSPTPRLNRFYWNDHNAWPSLRKKDQDGELHLRNSNNDRGGDDTSEHGQAPASLSSTWQDQTEPESTNSEEFDQAPSGEHERERDDIMVSASQPTPALASSARPAINFFLQCENTIIPLLAHCDPSLPLTDAQYQHVKSALAEGDFITRLPAPALAPTSLGKSVFGTQRRRESAPASSVLGLSLSHSTADEPRSRTCLRPDTPMPGRQSALPRIASRKTSIDDAPAPAPAPARKATRTRRKPPPPIPQLTTTSNTSSQASVSVSALASGSNEMLPPLPAAPLFAPPAIHMATQHVPVFPVPASASLSLADPLVYDHTSWAMPPNISADLLQPHSGSQSQSQAQPTLWYDTPMHPVQFDCSNFLPSYQSSYMTYPTVYQTDSRRSSMPTYPPSNTWTLQRQPTKEDVDMQLWSSPFAQMTKPAVQPLAGWPEYQVAAAAAASHV